MLQKREITEQRYQRVFGETRSVLAEAPFRAPCRSVLLVHLDCTSVWIFALNDGSISLFLVDTWTCLPRLAWRTPRLSQTLHLHLLDAAGMRPRNDPSCWRPGSPNPRSFDLHNGRCAAIRDKLPGSYTHSPLHNGRFDSYQPNSPPSSYTASLAGRNKPASGAQSTVLLS